MSRTAGFITRLCRRLLPSAEISGGGEEEEEEDSKLLMPQRVDAREPD